MNERKTAAGFLAELSTDVEYLKMRKLKDAALKKELEDISEAEIPLVEDLRRVGVDVNSVWDLVNSSKSYTAALPVLLGHMHKPYPEKIREGIFRALAVPEARIGWHELLAIFEKKEKGYDGRIRWVVAVALGATADDSVLKDLLEIVGNLKNGFDRAALLPALFKSNSAQARTALDGLLADPEIGKEVKRLRRITRKNAINSGGT
jgi:hypothetical protein